MPDATSSRELVRRYLEGRSTERPPVVMHLGSYAARLQQMTYEQLCSDATLLANSLQSAQKLFGCDGLIVLVDPTIEAEACGCEIVWHDDEPAVSSHPLAPADAPPDAVVEGVEGRGRLLTVLEATRRLTAVIGKDVALFPAVTGPVTLASHLRGPAFWTDLDEDPEQAYRTLETAGQVTLRVARQYLDMGFEQLVVSDRSLGRVDPAHHPRIASVLRSLWNVAEFYDARVLLQTEVDDPAGLEALLTLGAGGLLVDGQASLGAVAAQADRRDQRLAAGLPAGLVETQAGDLEQAVAVWRAGACPPGSLAACCTITRSTPPENVHAVVRLLRGS